jgi:hypothetical protein
VAVPASWGLFTASTWLGNIDRSYLRSDLRSAPCKRPPHPPTPPSTEGAQFKVPLSLGPIHKRQHTFGIANKQRATSPRAACDWQALHGTTSMSISSRHECGPTWSSRLHLRFASVSSSLSKNWKRLSWACILDKNLRLFSFCERTFHYLSARQRIAPPKKTQTRPLRAPRTRPQLV